MSPGLRQDAHRVMVGFVLRGWHVAEGAEEAAVVVPVDPLQRGKLQVLEAAMAMGSREVSGLARLD